MKLICSNPSSDTKSGEEAAESRHRWKILINVLMETDDAGLNLLEFIRDELGNRMIRPVMRTVHSDNRALQGY